MSFTVTGVEVPGITAKFVETPVLKFVNTNAKTSLKPHWQVPYSFDANIKLKLKLSVKGVKLNPSEIQFQLNLAHVYLFTDRISEAKAIHKQYAQENLSSGKSWQEQTKSDFKAFDKYGLPTDNFKKILRILE